ncbi:MAG: secondary thiamine-phosphate synthase enzyme YjbQ, partial [Verrucomicrobiae bacterium]|nr:secondary thiamine-phosphate synthase enzyme YjbQ [Verrucomicrobiae bacterium]
ELVDITRQVQEGVRQSGCREGVCVVYVPHTTAGITVQEHADPDVVRDLVYVLDRLVPWNDPKYRHTEGNTAAHVKSALVGHSAHLLVRDSRLQLGTWQGIFFCEFDGPRTRHVWVRVQG